MQLLHSNQSLMPKTNLVWIMTIAGFQATLFVCSIIVIIILIPIILSPNAFFYMVRRYNKPQYDFLRDNHYMKEEVIKSPIRMELFDETDIFAKMDFFSNFMDEFMKHMQSSAMIYLGLAGLIIFALTLVYISFYFRVLILLLASVVVFIVYLSLLLYFGGPTNRFNADILKVVVSKTSKFTYSMCETCKPNPGGWTYVDRELFEMSRFNCCGWMNYKDVSYEAIGDYVTPFCCKNYSWFSIDWRAHNQLVIPLINKKRINVTQNRCHVKDSKPGCFHTLKQIWIIHYPLVFTLYTLLDMILYLCAILQPIFAILIIILCIRIMWPKKTENLKMQI